MKFRGADLREGGPNMLWQWIKDSPKMGAFVIVENGDQVLDSLGSEDATCKTFVNRMVLLSTANLAMSWFGLEWHPRMSRPKKNHKVSQKKQENDVDAPKWCTLPHSQCSLCSHQNPRQRLCFVLLSHC